MVLSGRISEAIEATHSLYPGLLDRNLGLLFKLKCRQFIEMVSGCDSEVKPSAHSPTRSAKSSPCASPSRTLSHTSIVSNASSSNSTTNGFDNGELGPPRSIDMAHELVGNGVAVDEDAEMDDMTDANQSTSNNSQSASTYQSSSNSNQYFNNPARGNVEGSSQIWKYVSDFSKKENFCILFFRFFAKHFGVFVRLRVKDQFS